MAELSNAQSWNDIADNYASWTAQRLRPFSEKVLARAALQPTDVVLDVACGPGTLTQLAAARVAAVEAVDFAPRMVEYCRENCPDNVRVQVADGHSLPFEDESFDAAFSMFGLAFFADRIRALAELRRVLKPGGRAWVSTWVPFADSQALSRLGPVMKILNPAMTPPEGIQMNNEQVIREEFAAAGFRSIEVYPLPGSLRVDDVDEMWERLVTGNLFVRHLREQVGEETFAERAPAAKAKFCEGLEAGQELEQPALLGSGWK